LYEASGFFNKEADYGIPLRFLGQGAYIFGWIQKSERKLIEKYFKNPRQVFIMYFG
jgi:hypothetical protein